MGLCKGTFQFLQLEAGEGGPEASLLSLVWTHRIQLTIVRFCNAIGAVAVVHVAASFIRQYVGSWRVLLSHFSVRHRLTSFAEYSTARQLKR